MTTTATLVGRRELKKQRPKGRCCLGQRERRPKGRRSLHKQRPKGRCSECRNGDPRVVVYRRGTGTATPGSPFIQMQRPRGRCLGAGTATQQEQWPFGRCLWCQNGDPRVAVLLQKQRPFGRCLWCQSFPVGASERQTRGVSSLFSLQGQNCNF
jgi:hypothetical protein